MLPAKRKYPPRRTAKNIESRFIEMTYGTIESVYARLIKIASLMRITPNAVGGGLSGD